ncbi:tRNA (guanosine(37)-N1)-methyltransferase TrmD [Membranihabitans maritimus]|uniref:tRNA (guanosine(37)-N1)-methyltransferase TrmD n=1 Tax=Membranihabitans maritimus TaxID=2904244 RepID=UPI001EFFCAF9|nr:tRNA (guanosine(37)-N1)-methyltransferase TrmD [Membranihabitans maritimus]
MRIDIIATIPELLDSPFQHSILKRASSKGVIDVNVHDLRKYGLGNYNQIDDYQYGGGAGMVLRIEPIFNCIEKLKGQRAYDEVIYMTPDGHTFNQKWANSFSLKKNLIILCGHYKGIDQRIRDHLVTTEISIGDYVLSGGELAAAVLVDAICRLVPGTMNDESSALEDSFQDGLLAPPIYTRPAEFNGWKVPEILLSGHNANIEEWREEMAYQRTKALRPDLLEDE